MLHVSLAIAVASGVHRGQRARSRRTLMLRVLASCPADATGAVTEGNVIGVLDASLAAFQAREGGQSQWNQDRLRASFQQLAAASLITSHHNGFRLTELGRFTGESGVHVD